MTAAVSEATANAVLKAGVMLMESGAEIYRVEDTMNRLCLSQPGITSPQSYVTATGVMLSFEVDGQVVTRIARVKNHKTNLTVVDAINDMSREAGQMSPEEIMARLEKIAAGGKYEPWQTMLMGGLGAGGFAVFFGGTLLEAVLSFCIGICIRILTGLISQIKINDLLVNLLASFTGTLLSVISHVIFPAAEISKLVISSIMLLAPGLAMTNAIRDTVSGDYLAGIARAAEAFLTATAIAVGSALVLLIWR